MIAHQDDDLLFMSPDLLNTIRAGKCVRTVFLTAGDAGGDSTYWLGRENGAKAAYAKMLNVNTGWTKTTETINGHPLAVFTNNSNKRLSLVFLRLPDGNMDGSGFSAYNNASLQKLWLGHIPNISAVDGTTTYTRSDLISTLANLIAGYQSPDIRTQDYVTYFGETDHSDHIAAAYLARSAQEQYGGSSTLKGYIDYDTLNSPANVSGTALTNKSNAFYAYAAHDPNVCGSAAACAGTGYEGWLARQYVAGTKQGGTAPSLVGVNVANLATVTASSEEAATGQQAIKAVDGSAEGYPLDASREWATPGGGAGSWLNLAWALPQTISRVVLFDRPNSSDQITSGTLTFSDGSTVNVGSLENNGWPTTVTFPLKVTSSLRLTVNTVSGNTYNIGLAEIQTWTP